MSYFNVGQLKEAIENLDNNTYIAIGERENNEIDEIRKESGIIEARMKSIGFDTSDRRYLKLYTKNFEESGCLRFSR